MNRRGFFKMLGISPAVLMLPKKESDECVYPYPPTHFKINGKFVPASKIQFRALEDFVKDENGFYWGPTRMEFY